MSKQFYNNVLLFFGIFKFSIPYRCDNGIAYIKLYVWHKIFHISIICQSIFLNTSVFLLSPPAKIYVSAPMVQMGWKKTLHAFTGRPTDITGSQAVSLF